MSHIPNGLSVGTHDGNRIIVLRVDDKVCLFFNPLTTERIIEQDTDFSCFNLEAMVRDLNNGTLMQLPPEQWDEVEIVELRRTLPGESEAPTRLH